MKTRDKIKHKARELFNTEGLNAVSSRHVSDALGISYGNLTYHFPKKDDLILQLYHDMQAELDEKVTNLRAEIFRFDFMIRSLRAMLAVLDKYRFIYLHLPELIRRFPEAKIHAQRQYQRRVRICREIYDFLITAGYLKPERHHGHYDKLAHGVMMLIYSWVVDAELFYTGADEDKIDHYLELIYRVVSASLTQSGSEAFMRVYHGPELREANSNDASSSPR
jgi:AcrR family transcriptional regulator